MRRLAVVLATSVLGLFGCRAHAVSTSQFVARGNVVCAVAAKRIGNLVIPRASPAVAPEQYAGYVDDYVAEVRLELANLRAIGYPAGQRARLEAEYNRLGDQLGAAERYPLGFRPGMLEPIVLVLRQAGLTACHA